MHASHREQRCEPPSASLIERDPEVIPDVEIAARVGKDLFLDEKIPKHESGQGYAHGSCETLDTVEEKGSLQCFHPPSANDMHGSRLELDDNEQPTTYEAREGRTSVVWTYLSERK